MLLYPFFLLRFLFKSSLQAREWVTNLGKLKVTLPHALRFCPCFFSFFSFYPTTVYGRGKRKALLTLPSSTSLGAGVYGYLFFLFPLTSSSSPSLALVSSGNGGVFFGHPLPCFYKCNLMPSLVFSSHVCTFLIFFFEYLL